MSNKHKNNAVSADSHNQNASLLEVEKSLALRIDNDINEGISILPSISTPQNRKNGFVSNNLPKIFTVVQPLYSTLVEMKCLH